MSVPIADLTDQLIELCQDYLAQVQYPMLASPFLQWVVNVADRNIIESDDQIRIKFMSARIWGCDELLCGIKSKLDLILNCITPPSSVTTADGYEIHVNWEPSYYENYRKLSQGPYVIESGVRRPRSRILIVGHLKKSDYRSLKEILKDAPLINHARDVAALLRECSIFDRVPDIELVNIDLLGVYLLKGSKGILIERYSDINHETDYCVGQLDSQCRTIISCDNDELIKLQARIRLPIRDGQTLENYNECFSRQIEKHPRSYCELVRLVKTNVSNPECFECANDFEYL